MDKNEIKRANRKALPQFMLIMVICFIIGGTIGFCSAKYGLNTLAGGMKTAGRTGIRQSWNRPDSQD